MAWKELKQRRRRLILIEHMMRKRRPPGKGAAEIECEGPRAPCAKQRGGFETGQVQSLCHTSMQLSRFVD